MIVSNTLTYKLCLKAFIQDPSEAFCKHCLVLFPGREIQRLWIGGSPARSNDILPLGSETQQSTVFLYSRLQIQTLRHTSSGQNLGLTGLLFYVYSLYFDVNIWHSIPNNNPFIPEYCQGVNPCMQSAVLYISVKPQNFSRYPEMCLQAEFPTLSSLSVHCIMNTGKSLTLQANQFNFIEFRQVEM